MSEMFENAPTLDLVLPVQASDTGFRFEPEP